MTGAGQWRRVLLWLGLWLALATFTLGPGAAFGHFTYSDIWALYRERHLATHGLPYWQIPIEYPVLMGWWMWATAWVPGFAGYLTANVLGLAGAAFGVLALLRRLRPDRYVWWAQLPILVPFAFLNWDLFGVLALVAAWDAWQRQRPGWTGLWLAVGTATKLFPIIAWPFMAYEWWRTGERRAAWHMTGTAAAVWLALNLPEMLGAWSGWSYFWRFNAGRPVGADLWWLLGLSHVTGTRTVDLLSLLIVAATALWALRRMAGGWSAPAASATVLAVFFLVNKVYSPQYMLWMLTGAVIAGWPVTALGLLTLGGILDWAGSLLGIWTAHDHGAAVLGLGAFVGAFVMRYSALVGGLTIVHARRLPTASKAIGIAKETAQ